MIVLCLLFGLKWESHDKQTRQEAQLLAQFVKSPIIFWGVNMGPYPNRPSFGYKEGGGWIEDRNTLAPFHFICTK